MDTQSYKTISLKAGDIKKEWVVIDATDLVLGRLAARVALVLRGKNKPSFTPHMDCAFPTWPLRMCPRAQRSPSTPSLAPAAASAVSSASSIA